MATRVVRAVVVGVCVIGIAGMIFGSVIDSNGVAITFGLLTAVAVLCLMVATAVAAPAAAQDDGTGRVDELTARLIAAGADETTVRELVRKASGLSDHRRS